MLRILRVENESQAPTLRVEGRLIGPWVEELRRSCERMLAADTALVLDLSEVCFVDRQGAELLSRLRARHVAISGCSRFVEEQLRAWEPRFNGHRDGA